MKRKHHMTAQHSQWSIKAYLNGDLTALMLHITTALMRCVTHPSSVCYDPYGLQSRLPVHARDNPKAMYGSLANITMEEVFGEIYPMEVYSWQNWDMGQAREHDAYAPHLYNRVCQMIPRFGSCTEDEKSEVIEDFVEFEKALDNIHIEGFDHIVDYMGTTYRDNTAQHPCGLATGLNEALREDTNEIVKLVDYHYHLCRVTPISTIGNVFDCFRYDVIKRVTSTTHHQLVKEYLEDFVYNKIGAFSH